MPTPADPRVKRGGDKTRQIVLRYARMGLKASEIATLAGISRQATYKHLQNLRDDGELEDVAS